MSSELEFSISQVNGCRYLVPNRESELANFVPPNGSEVYVSKLPLDCSEIELFRYVSTKGRVFDVRMMVAFSGLNRGFAFVRYYSPEEADEAIQYLPGKPIRLSPPWYVSMQKSTDHRRLLLVGMNRRNASEEIQNLFDIQYPGQLAAVVELQTVKPIYILEFISHKVAAVSKRLNAFPVQWGRVQLMWQPNEDVENRLKIKKEREMTRKIFQDGREMYLKHTEKSVTPTQTVHQPMYTKSTCGQLPSWPASSSAPPTAQPTGPSALAQSVYGRYPSTAQAAYDHTSSLLHYTQRVFGEAPSTTRATYDEPSAIPLQPKLYYGGGPSIAQATYGQSPSTSQPTHGEGSSVPHTSLARASAFAGLGCAEWKHCDDFSEEDSKYRSNLHQFRSNSPTAYYPTNAGHKALEASMSARKSAAFGYSDWSQKENVPANKPDPTASISFFPDPKYSATVGHGHNQTGFSSGGVRPVLGRENMTSPPSPSKTLRF